MSNTPQGEAIEGNAADDALMVNQCSPIPFQKEEGYGKIPISLDLTWCFIYKCLYRLPDKDFGLRYRSESSTTYLYVRLTRVPPSGLAKIII
jgi:hypothetical protein